MIAFLDGVFEHRVFEWSRSITANQMIWGSKTNFSEQICASVMLDKVSWSYRNFSSGE